jgi:hypothetical protein
LEHVFLAFRSRRPELRGAAEEVLFELLRAPWREAALAVLEPDGLGETPVRAPWSQAELTRPEFFIGALLGHSSEMLRVLAAYLASERDWAETIPDLHAASQTMGQENRELVEEAISHLAGPGEKLHG